MKILRLQDFLINEKVTLQNEDGILVIVDVQSNFKKYFPNNPNSYLKKLDKYCEGFPEDSNLKGVYQIWDSNNGSKPTYKFKNQKALIEKKYGIKSLYSKYNGGFKEWIYYIFDEKTLEQYNSKNGKFKEGDAFKIKNKNEFLIYIGNNHKWFYVDEELYNFFKTLRGKKIIIVGGADSECLEDVYITLKSFRANPVYNHLYIYSADTGNKK
ncbi:hypothetical protein M0Q97_11275 [Candidatus Dojkabacteria bacterium]|jgi:hypothetical protein|nr:hypothetical protein [Candidatus Dojkabacteria bacterium]